MATVTTQERTNILKLVAGMFNAAPGAAYLNEFTNAFVDLNKDLGALANALGQTGAFQSLYPSFLTADEFANKFLDTLGLKANTEAQDWVKAKVNAGESFASVVFQALVAIDASTFPVNLLYTGVTMLATIIVSFAATVAKQKKVKA